MCETWDTIAEQFHNNRLRSINCKLNLSPGPSFIDWNCWFFNLCTLSLVGTRCVRGLDKPFKTISTSHTTHSITIVQAELCLHFASSSGPRMSCHSFLLLYERGMLLFSAIVSFVVSEQTSPRSHTRQTGMNSVTHLLVLNHSKKRNIIGPWLRLTEYIKMTNYEAMRPLPDFPVWWWSSDPAQSLARPGDRGPGQEKRLSGLFPVSPVIPQSSPG